MWKFQNRLIWRLPLFISWRFFAQCHPVKIQIQFNHVMVCKRTQNQLSLWSWSRAIGWADMQWPNSQFAEESLYQEIENNPLGRATTRLDERLKILVKEKKITEESRRHFRGNRVNFGGFYLQVRLKKLGYEKIGYLLWGNVEAQNINCISLTGPKLIYSQLYVGIIEQLWFPHNDH